jgi:hypothetical protein
MPERLNDQDPYNEGVEWRAAQPTDPNLVASIERIENPIITDVASAETSSREDQQNTVVQNLQALFARTRHKLSQTDIYKDALLAGAAIRYVPGIVINHIANNWRVSRYQPKHPNDKQPESDPSTE